MYACVSTTPLDLHFIHHRPYWTSAVLGVEETYNSEQENHHAFPLKVFDL